jgi:adenylate cyclase
MPRNSDEVTILLADITGSTPLYETAGDAAAARQVADCLGRMKAIAGHEGGTFIRSRGDDILCTFAVAASALKATRLMLFQLSAGPLAIHAGVHFGHIIKTHDDLFGDAVNLTARLAACAKPGELLASRSFVDQLAEPDKRSFRVLDNMTFKGRNAATEVYSFLAEAGSASTEMVAGRGAASQNTMVMLRYQTESWQCQDRDTVSIGRSPDCDLVIGQPWISRKHAVLTVRRGKVQLDDQSASGTYVTMQGGEEAFLHRETALLTGAGNISPARRPTEAGAEIIHYEITHV